MTKFDTEKRGKIYMVISDGKDIGYAVSSGFKGSWRAVYCDKPLGLIFSGSREDCLKAIRIKFVS